MTESCSSAAVAGEVEVLRLELAEAGDVAVAGGGGAHLSTNDIAVPPPPADDVDDDAAAAAASLLPRMKSLSDELEPHFEDPDALPDADEGIAIDTWTIREVARGHGHTPTEDDNAVQSA